MNDIHPTAIIGDNVVLGSDNYIGPYCYFTGDVEVGNNNRFEAYCSIGSRAEHTKHWDKEGRTLIGSDCVFREFITIHGGTKGLLTFIDDNVIEDGVTLSCGVKIGGHVHVMRDSNLGMGVVIHQYQVIGSWSMMGMGTIVPKKAKIYPGQTWVGNPVYRLKTNMYAANKFNVGEFAMLEETARYKELVKAHDI